ncbi:MAG: 4-hydroxy-tetrahydrodipicolinate synthase [Zavarzinella sp.]
MQVRGIVPPIVTPMLANEEIDFPRLRQVIDRQIEAGVSAIFVLGTTGECYALDLEEKRQVIIAARDHIAGRVPLFAGTGAETTREAITITHMAAAEGVAGISVITPYFVMPTQAELVGHYRRIADATSLPVILYSNPATCGGLKISPETVAKLSEVPNIVAIKDSSGDLQNLIETVRLVPPDFAVLQGRDTLIAPALMFGAKGAVPASANIVPHWCVAIFQHVQAGRFEDAKAVQAKLSPVRLALMLGTAPGVVKEAMRIIGWDVGPSRSPIAPLTGNTLAQLRSILDDAGLIP